MTSAAASSAETTPESSSGSPSGQAQTFASADAVDLAQVRRSGFVESRHRGSAAVVGPDGALLLGLGDVTTPVFPRSALKPFQAAASLAHGAPLQWDQIAVAAGSHQATAEQVASVRSILTKVRLTETALRCPATATSGRPLSADDGGSPLHHNCSGKHAAFLAACVESGWDLESYLDPHHPLQEAVVRTVTELAGEQPPVVGVDGCGAPLPALSLSALGRMYSALGAAAYNIQADARLATVATAMLDYPEFVHAPGRSNTVVMTELGVIAKLGAEGVLCLATQDGVSAVVKMLDGNGRANNLVALELLVAVGALDRARVAPVLERVTPSVNGADEVVGGIELSPEVREATASYTIAGQGS